MTVEQVAPCQSQVDLSAVLAGLKQAEYAALEPFSDEVIEFCADFSRALFKDAEATRYAELQALAFWMRKAELARMRDEFASLTTADTVRAPRGLVFHVPPANVDTIFMYSWLVAVLTGNRNIIRLSPQASGQTEVICRAFNATLKTAGGVLRQNTVMLRYGHEEEITAEISAAADVRILWGGDATIRTIRAIPLAPHATELTFPDRYSFAVIHAGRYLAAAAQRRQRLAEEFFNDTFWFDQMACSSPRLVIWQGEPTDAEAASREFLALLKACTERKGYQVQPQTRLNRFTFACGAAVDEKASAYRDLEEFTVLGVDSLQQLSREHCGGGLLYQHRIATLEELIPFVQRRDQTMTYFGFEPAELRTLAARLNGRGVDRMVPTGQALQFHRFWDGYDLFQELTRHVYIGA
jgi:acyl-CoA reductase LuxC